MFSSKEVLITIVKRNYLIFLILLAGSFTFGLITLFQLIWLTAWFGIEIGVFARQYGINFCIRGIMPHAPLEMVSFLIISTISFYISQNFIIYLLKNRPISLNFKKILLYIIIAGVILFIAALLETYFTPFLLQGG